MVNENKKLNQFIFIAKTLASQKKTLIFALPKF